MPSSYVVPVPESPPGENLSLVSVINFVLRNLPFMVVVGLVLGGVLAIVASTKPITYTASASFITEGEQPAGRLILGGLNLPATSGKGPEFYVELLRSPAILGPLVESSFQTEPGQPPKTLVEHYGGSKIVTQSARESAIGAVSSRISTKISLNGIITLRVKAETPVLAAVMAQGILEQVDEFNDTKRKLQASAERRFAEQRLRELAIEVEAAENRYRWFLERNRRIESPALRIELDHISADMSGRRALHSSAEQAVERAKLDEIRDSPRATVLASPLPPLNPDGRTTRRNGILGFFAGMLLAAMVALVREFFARIPRQSSPEAQEYADLRARTTERLRRWLLAVVGAVRRPRPSSSKP